jgi:AcrB/AcrD/AcrF family/Transposase
VRLIGYVAGGLPGQRLLARLSIATSDDTVLRRVRQEAMREPPWRPLRNLGVDDWAWRKGQEYGTILVDVELRHVVDLLPDRAADSFSEWLRHHPEIMTISRDRSGLYAEGATLGSAIKPLIVFAAVPYGAVGALFAIWVMGSPFGFMGFLGIVSLVGVIVSHIIVLFDFIEEKHAEGEPFEQAVLDAGIMRLRPVMITVGATVIALIPLAMHGGPLWEPMCYAQIGGLVAATFITLLLVPVIYSICVLDLRIVKWEISASSITGEPEVPCKVEASVGVEDRRDGTKAAARYECTGEYPSSSPPYPI